MTIILPIFFAAVIVGLFARRVTAIHWLALAVLIILVIAYQFVKPSPLSVPTSVPTR